jgi:hypothetical protein
VLNNDVYFNDGVLLEVGRETGGDGSRARHHPESDGVWRVYRKEQLSGTDPLTQQSFLSHYEGRSGEIKMLPRAYWHVGLDDDHGTGIATTPACRVILFGSASRRAIDEVAPMDLAPTLAFLTGATLPDAMGRVPTRRYCITDGRAATPPRASGRSPSRRCACTRPRRPRSPIAACRAAEIHSTARRSSRREHVAARGCIHRRTVNAGAWTVAHEHRRAAGPERDAEHAVVRSAQAAQRASTAASPVIAADVLGKNRNAHAAIKSQRSVMRSMSLVTGTDVTRSAPRGDRAS